MNGKSTEIATFEVAINSVNEKFDSYSGRKVSAVAGLIAVASFSGAEAQQSTLPPVTVDAPVARPRPAASQPVAGAAQGAQRAAARRAPHAAGESPRCRSPMPAACARTAIPMPIRPRPTRSIACRHRANSPSRCSTRRRPITVLTKELLEDKNATTLKEAVRTTAGVTLGTGEGGNAFGDRFFIRGFDARNDIFIDGVRDPGVSVRENFFTEQVEILRGPGSSFAGRGTTGGAINIVTKQATTEKSFYNMDTTFGTDQTKRVVLDVNQVISPTLRSAPAACARTPMSPAATISSTIAGAASSPQMDADRRVKVTANYIHTDLHGCRTSACPIIGRVTGPAQQFHHGRRAIHGIRRQRNNFYGFVNRDFHKIKQDIGTINGEVADHAGSCAQQQVQGCAIRSELYRHAAGSAGAHDARPCIWTLSANPQSRYQVTDVIANQTDATYKFNTGRLASTPPWPASKSRPRNARASTNIPA